MPARREMSLEDQEVHHGNARSALGRADQAIRRARSLHNNLYKMNVCTQKVGEASFGRLTKLTRKRTDTIDALLTESKLIGRALIRARQRDMRPSDLRKYLDNFNALVALLGQIAEDAKSLAEHWTEMHRYMEQIAAIYTK
jgi:hypothetical protein